MATFIYKIIHDDSRVRWGVGRYPFQDSDSLRNFLERTGATTVFATAMPKVIENTVIAGYHRMAAKRIPGAVLSEFLRNIGVMIRAGVPFIDAVKHATGSSDNVLLKRVSDGVAMAVESGLGVYTALNRYAEVFPPQMLHIIRVGEATAQLDQAFLAAANHVQRVTRLKVDVKKALIYPFIAFVAALCACLFWLYYTVPTMIDLYKQMGVVLPAATQWVLNFAQLLRSNTSSVLFFLVATLVLLRLFYVCNGRCRLVWQKIILRIPVLGRASRNAGVAYFAEYFSMLLKAGVDTYKSLGVVADSIDNEAYRQVVRKVQQGVERGNAISAEMERYKLFPGMVCRMVKTGEQTGTLPDQLSYIADEYSSRLNDVIDRVKTLVEPVAIFLVGLLMIGIVISMFLPIYNLVMNMGGG